MSLWEEIKLVKNGGTTRWHFYRVFVFFTGLSAHQEMLSKVLPFSRQEKTAQDSAGQSLSNVWPTNIHFFLILHSDKIQFLLINPTGLAWLILYWPLLTLEGVIGNHICVFWKNFKFKRFIHRKKVLIRFFSHVSTESEKKNYFILQRLFHIFKIYSICIYLKKRTRKTNICTCA